MLLSTLMAVTATAMSTSPKLAEVQGTYDELYYSQTLDHGDPTNTVRTVRCTMLLSCPPRPCFIRPPLSVGLNVRLPHLTGVADGRLVLACSTN